MKKHILVVIALVLLASMHSIELLGQAPQQISFQGILRDNDGVSLKNQQSTITLSIFNASTQSLLYQETHSTTSDNFGLIHLSLGTGTPVSGTFNAIAWGSSTVSFTVTATLPNNTILEIAEQSFKSVPYALHAATASSLSGANDVDNTNELNQALSFDGTVLRITDQGGELSTDLSSLSQNAEQVPFQNNGTSLTSTNVQGAIAELATSLSTVNTDQQTLTLDSTSLSISGGNVVNLAPLKDDADANPNNELNLNFVLNGTNLTLSDAGGDLVVDLSSTNQNAAQVPFDNTGTNFSATDVQAAINELASDLAVVNTDAQTLSFNGSSISITGGNSVDISALGNDADANATNEIQHLSISGSTISLSNSANQINLTALGADADDQTAAQVPYSNAGTTLTSTNVQGAINEIVSGLSNLDTDNQTLSFDGSTLSIADGNNVDLSALENDADASPTNEIQHLSINGTTISLSGSGDQINLTALGVEADDQNASQVAYDNTGTGLSSTTVQSAIHELADDMTTVNTDAQTLSFNGTSLSIAGGNSIDISALEDDADASPTNEIQHLSINGTTISLTGSGDQINLTGLGAEADDQTAAQVPYNGTASNMDATHVQGALEELAAEKVRNLQEAYAADPLITLDGADDLIVNTNAGARVMTVANSGRVGIGTTSPLNDLDIRSSGPDVPATLKISNSDNTHRLTLFPGRANNANPFIGVQIGDPLRFASYDGANVVEFMRINPNGSVGVGIAAPQGKFHVSGTTSNMTGPLDAFENSFALSTEAGSVFQFSKGSDQAWAAGVASVITGTGTSNAILAHSNGTEAISNRGIYAAASGGDQNYGAVGNAFQSANDNIGVRGLGQAASTTNTGVFGTANGIAGSSNYGGYFSTGGGGTTSIGVYATATGATTNWAGWFQGNVRVQGGLTVNGSLMLNGKSINGDLGNSNFSFGTGLAAITTGQRNVGMINALNALTTGSDNIAIGSGTLQDVTAGNGNIALGRYVMLHASGGEYNLGLGLEVLRNNTTGQRNIGMGYLMLRQNTTGSNNVAMGAFAMDNNISGSGNVVIGQQAGGGLLTSNNNVAVGTFANISNNANRAVAIGYQAVSAQDDAITLGDPYNANVRVGIGTNAPSQKLHVVGDVLVTGVVTATNIAAPSDRRLKTNIESIPDALTTVSQLNGVAYNWIKDDPSTAKTEFGLIAQDLEKIIPELVKTNADGFKSVNYVSLIPFLIEAIKTQQKEIEQLKAENSAMKATLDTKIEALASAIKSLQSASQHSVTTLADDKK